jgi:hypothetical protein
MFDDFKDLLSAFNVANVRYLVVGGYAVSLHSQPRATKYLDIFIATDAQNSEAVFRALAKFGAPVEGLSASDFRDPESFFRMGTPPVMIDIMPRISGVEFEGAWQRRVDIEIDDKLMVPFISRDDLLAAKISAGRAQDLADVAALRDSAGHAIAHYNEGSTGGLSAMDEIRRTRREVAKSGLRCGESRRR